jgi:hypothetical protein
MAEAMAEDLAALRKHHPKASQADVLRSWSRMANRTRRVKALAEWQEKARTLAGHANAASLEAEALRKQMAAYEAKEDAQRSKAITAALRVLRAPQNAALRQELAGLVHAEDAGKPLATANFAFSRARRELGSFRALQDLAGAPQ